MCFYQFQLTTTWVLLLSKEILMMQLKIWNEERYHIYIYIYCVWYLGPHWSIIIMYQLGMWHGLVTQIQGGTFFCGKHKLTNSKPFHSCFRISYWIPWYLWLKSSHFHLNATHSPHWADNGTQPLLQLHHGLQGAFLFHFDLSFPFVVSFSCKLEKS